MAFNFGAFMGGAVDQYNQDRNARQRQQQIDQSGEATQEQILSSKQLREAREREAKRAAEEQEVAQTEAAMLGQIMSGQAPGQAPDMPQTAIPQIQQPAAQEGPAAVPQAAPAQAPAAAPAAPGPLATAQPAAQPAAQEGPTVTKPGGYGSLTSDALYTLAQWQSQQPTPAMRSRAAQNMEKAKQMRFGEAFELAVQKNDFSGAATHLRGAPTQVSIEKDGTVTMRDAQSGEVLDQGRSKDDWLQRLASSGTPQTFTAYQKLMDDQLSRALENQQKEEERRWRRELDLAKLGARTGVGSKGDRADKVAGVFESDIEMAKYLEKLYPKAENMRELVTDFKAVMALNPEVRDPSMIAEAAEVARAQPQTLRAHFDADTGTPVMAAPTRAGGLLRVTPLNPDTPRFTAGDEGPEPLDPKKAAELNKQDMQKALTEWGATDIGKKFVGGFSSPEEALLLGQKGIVIHREKGQPDKQIPLGALPKEEQLALANAAQIYLAQHKAKNLSPASKAPGESPVDKAQARIDEAKAANIEPSFGDRAKVAVGGAGRWVRDKASAAEDNRLNVLQQETQAIVRDYIKAGRSLDPMLRSKVVQLASQAPERAESILNELPEAWRAAIQADLNKE